MIGQIVLITFLLSSLLIQGPVPICSPLIYLPNRKVWLKENVCRGNQINIVEQFMAKSNVRSNEEEM